jgi:hypothetical protein
MALVQLGVTTCGLCGGPIDALKAWLSFSAFVSNESDPLYRFNDAAFHEDCLDADPLGNVCLSLWSEFLAKRGPDGLPCEVCSEPILHFRDHLSLGLISSDRKSSLYAFNFLQFHRSHVARWSARVKVTAMLRIGLSDQSIGGVGFLKLVDELESLTE